MKINKIVWLFMIALIGFPSLGNANAESRPGIKTEVSFGYDTFTDETKWIPQIQVYRSDFSDGSVEMETYAYPEGAVPVPQGGSLRDGCGASYYDQHLTKGKSGLTAYWSGCYTSTAKVNGKTKEEFVYSLFAFDLTTKQWNLLTKTKNLRLLFYPAFGGYATFPADYYADAPEVRRVSIYSLPSNKLLAKANNLPGESDFSSIEEDNFNRRQAGNSLIVSHSYTTKKKPVAKDGLEFYDGGNGYYVTETFELFNDGKTKGILPTTKRRADRYYEKKVGKMTYSRSDSNKVYRYGYWTGSKFTPITRPGRDGRATFSPSEKYMILTEILPSASRWSRDMDYVTSIREAATGKPLRELPMYGNGKLNHVHHYSWNYGDELVGITFTPQKAKLVQYRGYLNVASGIFSYAFDHQSNNPRDEYYSGVYADLLSPDTPPQVVVDGRNAVYGGQGAFQYEDGKWAIGVQDFAAAAKAEIVREGKKLSLVRGDSKVVLAENALTVFQGKAYAPIETLAKGLGGKVSVKKRFVGNRSFPYVEVTLK